MVRRQRSGKLFKLVNNIPSTYSATSDTTIPYITFGSDSENSDSITVTTQYEHFLTAGVPIVKLQVSQLITAEAILTLFVCT